MKRVIHTTEKTLTFTAIRQVGLDFVSIRPAIIKWSRIA